MDFPSLYDPEKVGQLYVPDVAGFYEAGQHTYLLPAVQDKPRILAWLVDVQVDFVFPAPVGHLSVPNAVEDTRRTVEWLYRNVQSITHIAASLDTHFPFHIFYPSWWQNDQGEHPAPYTIVSAEDVHSGKWKAVTEPEWSRYYVDTLESGGKKQLMIWPFHCIEGTVGRALVPALSEAIVYHSAARMDQPTYLPKGTIAQTEFYSVVEPEVKYPDHPEGRLNTRFLEIVEGFDLIYIAGQARSHCVLETMHSIVRHFSANNSDVLGKIRFLNDCTSSIPGFEETTEAQLKRFEAQGVIMVDSTAPLG